MLLLAIGILVIFVLWFVLGEEWVRTVIFLGGIVALIYVVYRVVFKRESKKIEG